MKMKCEFHPIDSFFKLGFSDTEQCFKFVLDASYVGGGGIPYSGPYNVTPNFSVQTLETKDKYMLDDVEVERIPVEKVSNPSGGKTVFIGGLF